MTKQYKLNLNRSFKLLKKEFKLQKDNELSDFKEKYTKLMPNESDRTQILKSLSEIERIYLENNEKIRQKFSPFIKHLSKLSLEINEESLVGYYKLEYEKLRKKWLETQELAQLGIAVEIIDHQCNALYSRLANIIDAIKISVKEDKKSQHKYSLLKTTFEHLENNYKLLTPLYRTTGRVRKDISGKEIKEYVKAFYDQDLIDNSIILNSTTSFNNASFFTYESILKPVFINIVNNAIYWLKSSDKKEILFDFFEEKMLIMNSGEQIHQVYIDDGDIFNLFFSRKPNGRGIGLYLAKTTLNGIGFDIEATNDPKFNKLNGACFLIKKIGN